MSELDRLIEKLCADGVEFVTLGDIGTITRGNGLSKNDFTESGIGCIHYGQIYTYYGMFAEATKSFVTPKLASQLKTVSRGDIIIAVTSENLEDVCKSVVWLGDEDIVTGGHTAILKHSQNAKYIAYCLQTEAFFQQKRTIAHGTKVVEVTPSKLEGIKIPLPPLPVQHEIARILDNFTEITAKLTAELTEELTSRKKQYEYYRNELLAFGDDVPIVPLGTVALNLDSKRKPVTKSNRETGKYPYYGASGIVDYVSDYIFDGDYLLVSEDGANLVTRVSPIAFSASGKSWVNNHAHILEFETYVERKFIEYYINMIDLSRFISTAAQPKLTQDNLNKIPVPAPSFAKQARIVTILDKFFDLTTNITNALSTEINARRKQYEYYRDKLLTFKEAGA